MACGGVAVGIDLILVDLKGRLKLDRERLKGYCFLKVPNDARNSAFLTGIKVICFGTVGRKHFDLPHLLRREFPFRLSTQDHKKLPYLGTRAARQTTALVVP